MPQVQVLGNLPNRFFDKSMVYDAALNFITENLPRQENPARSKLPEAADIIDTLIPTIPELKSKDDNRAVGNRLRVARQMASYQQKALVPEG